MLSVSYPIVYIKTPVMLRGMAGEKCKIYLSTPNGEYPLTPSPIPCGIVGHSHTPPLCFATQNIGRWHVVPEGLENTGSGSDRVEPPLPRCLSKEIDGVSEKIF